MKKQISILINFSTSAAQWLIHPLFQKYTVKAIGMPECIAKLSFRGAFWKMINLTCRVFFAFYGVLVTKKHAALLVWDNTFIGVCCSFFNQMLFRNQKILLLNMIDHPTTSKLFLKIKKLVYKRAFKKNFFAVVDSTHTQDFLCSAYQLNPSSFFIVRDTYGDLKTRLSGFAVTNDHSIFCGGSSNRDWETFMAVAKELPATPFVAVARKNWTPKQVLPPNLTLYYDLPFDDFIKYLSGCDICLLPLTTNTKSGFSVLFQAVLLKKNVIITDTVSSRCYIHHGVTGMLVPIHNKDEIVQMIQLLKADPEKAKKMTDRLYHEIQELSPEQYTSAISNLISDL